MIPDEKCIETDVSSNPSPKTVAIALSGGIDSAYAAYVLRTSLLGPEDILVGCSHRIWPGSPADKMENSTRAKAVCERLEIPYFLLDCTEAFIESVINPFVSAYLRGKTPNPCVECNQRIRFKHFYQAAAARLRTEGLLPENKPLYFSTGHYVRTTARGGHWYLRRGADPRKDQSYMLYRVEEELLPRLLFPLGNLQKRDVRRLSLQLQLPAAKIKESQDICFIPGSYADFIRERTEENRPFTPGKIIAADGTTLGSHRGYIHYTIGQRRGLGLGNGPWYVAAVKPSQNLIIAGREDEVKQDVFEVENCSWFGPFPKAPFSALVQTRYNASAVSCRIVPGASGVKVTLDSPGVISPGQSAVFYREDVCIGGGTIR